VATRRTKPCDLPFDAATIDLLYGLEPAYEAQTPAMGAGPTEFIIVDCPYCREPFGTRVELTDSSISYR